MCSSPATVEGLFPATAGQERHWFLHRYEDDPASQNLSQIRELHGSCDVPALAAAIRATVDAHDALRRQFLMTELGLRWRYADEPCSDVSVIELGDCPEVELRDAAVRCQRGPLDPERGRVFRARIVTGRGRCLVCLTVHASVADDRSLTLLFEELARRLDSVAVDPAADDSVEWPATATEAAARYWSERVAAELPHLELPESAERPARKRYAAATVVAAMPGSVVERLKAFCRAGDCTASAVLLAAYVAVLRRWTRQETLVIGRHVDLRGPERSRAIGCFDNLLPTRVEVPEQITFGGLLRAVQQQLDDDGPHESFPYAAMIKLAEASRDPSRNPLFQAAFRLTAGDDGASGGRLVPATAYERPMLPLDVELRARLDDAGGGSLTLVYDPTLFDESMMARLLAHCLRQLDLGMAEPHAAVLSLELTDASERTQLLALNPPSAPVSDATLLDLFDEAVARFPDRIAVAFHDQRLSYQGLDRLANAIAAALRDAGLESGACVGVCLDRSVAMVATVLGVLKCGAAYVPMDPAYPDERLGVIVDDSAAPLVVTQARYRDRLPASVGVLVYEEHLQDAGDGGRVVEPSVDAGSLAYVIFTSGSTGRPKGVAMPHRALVNLIRWQLARETFEHGARVLQYSSLSFDVSFQEIFSTWSSGGTLCLVDDEERRDPRRLLALLEELSIERLFLPYVALRQLIEVAQRLDRHPRALREVITAGEQLRVDSAVRDFFRRLPGASLDNQYGPSETHVVTAELLTGDPDRWPTLPPIGAPISNTQAYVLDEFRHLVPQGVAGELYLAGTNVARGYLGRNDLTRERFLEDPYGPGGSRMYRTGDLVRCGPDGRLEFLGRIDHQVKIRGYRIEPGEIDAVLGELPGVKQCLTKVTEDEQLGKRLVSYVLVDDPASFDVAAARDHAGRRLPGYMVPAAVMPLAELPFTPSGKVDMRALPAADVAARAPRARVPADTPTERALVATWQALLGLPEVGVDESFFEVGGDSLKAVDLFLEIDRKFGRDLPLSVLASSDTIRSLAAVIDGRQAASDLTGYRALKLIQTGRPGENPLFMVHGGGGNVILFSRFARQVSADLPVYAFQWTGWSDARGSRSIADMAELYLTEMRRLRPHGPYRLGGHCIGGMVALEMARRLQAAGERLDGPLIVTDTPNLRARSYRASEPALGSPDADAFAAMRRDLECRLAATRDVGDPAAPAPAAYRPQHGRWFKRLVRLLRILHERVSRESFPRYRVETALERAYVRLLLATGRRVPIHYRGVYAALSMVAAIGEHRPQPYDGDVVYFRTRVLGGRDIALRGWWSSLYLGFDELCRGNWEGHVIDASHDGVVQHPVTAEIVRRSLRL